MDKDDPVAVVPTNAIDPYADDVTSLASGGPGEAKVRLDCSECATPTHPVRKDGDPDTIARCARCGKKHSTASLTTVMD